MYVTRWGNQLMQGGKLVQSIPRNNAVYAKVARFGGWKFELKGWGNSRDFHPSLGNHHGILHKPYAESCTSND